MTCSVCGVDNTDANAIHRPSIHLKFNGGMNLECDYCGATIEHGYDVRYDEEGYRCEYCRRAKFTKELHRHPGD